MIKINALVDLFFKDLSSWEDRVRAIASCGCRYIETWQGGDASVLRRMSDAGRECGVSLISIVINSPKDHQVAPVRSENLKHFLAHVDRYADNALAAGCRHGIITTGPAIEGYDTNKQREALCAALRAAGESVADRGFHLNLEPLNTIVDHNGYFLDDPREGVDIIKEVKLPNVRILYDIYHMTIMTGNQTAFIEQNIEWIGHFHVAGVPGRHEPFDGETNYPFLLKRIAEAGYEGFVGLEYIPTLPCPQTIIETLSYLNPKGATHE